MKYTSKNPLGPKSLHKLLSKLGTWVILILFLWDLKPKEFEWSLPRKYSQELVGGAMRVPTLSGWQPQSQTHLSFDIVTDGESHASKFILFICV